MRTETDDKRVMVVYGTRPEGIKMAPLVRALEAHDALTPVVVTAGQHKHILEQVNDLFGITPDHDLDLMAPGQALNAMSAKLLTRLDPILESEKPDAIVVQGDTTTVAVSALAAFHRQIPVVHLEAGLRSGDISSPFPEEGNRLIAGQVAALHLAPTPQAKANLLREAFNPDIITVTGNTVIDALHFTGSQPVQWPDERLAEVIASDRPIILLTTHRRENWGAPMEATARAVARIAAAHPDHTVVVPMHPNPIVRDALVPNLQNLANVVLIDALDYLPFTHLMKRAMLVLTDSGGVQEEAPSFGKPVLVLRENTERPEAVTAGTVELVGTDEQLIVERATALLGDPAEYARMANAINPYGDGRAAQRCAAAIAALLGVGDRLPEFGVQ